LINPFVGLAVYYALATIYPQYLWKHSLPAGVRWSLMVGLATLAGFVLQGFVRSRAGARWPLQKVLMLVLAGWMCLSVIDAIDPDLARRQFSDYAKIFVMFFVACALFDSRYRLHVLGVVLVMTLGWVAFDFNQRYVFMGQKQVAYSGFAGIDNNGIAALMVIGLPLCMFLFGQERKWWLKWPPLLAMTLMLHVVLFSMSRAGMLGAMVVLPVLLLRLKRRWVGTAVLIVMLCAGLRLAGPEVRKRFGTIANYEADTSATDRLAAWRIGLEVIRENPFLGVGPDCFRRMTGKYEYELRGLTMHNRFLQTAVDMGVPAALCLIGALLLSLFRMEQLRWRCRSDPFVHDLATCLQASLLGYMVVGMFASIDTIELPYIVLAMSIGLQNVVAEERSVLAAEPAPARLKKVEPGLTGMKPALA
jgi:probable O-glycosylation ligase (exosortase A-associated)